MAQQAHGVRCIGKLVDTVSNWRILNLMAVNGAADEDTGFSLTPRDVPVKLFDNRILNSAVFVKHNLRGNETDLFRKPVAIATKVIIPIDKDHTSLGARTFFVNERTFDDMLMAATGIPSSPAGKRNLDRKKLHLLDDLPSLDAFLISEVMSHNGFDVKIPEDWFDESLGTEGKSYLRKQFEPLLELALGRNIGSSEREKFLREVFFSPESESSIMLARAMRVAPEQWPHLLFTWKASIYYEWSTRDIYNRYDEFLERYKNTRIYAGNDITTTVEIQGVRDKFGQHADHLQTTVRDFQKRFNQQYRENFLEKGDPGLFRDYLINLKSGLLQFGSAYARLEHLISYWNYAVVDKDMSTLPADYFFEVYRAVSSMKDPESIKAAA